MIATQASVRAGTYKKTLAELDPDIQVFAKACPLFVPLVENGRFHRGDMLERYRGLGKARIPLIYVLCDETFSLVSTLNPPEDIDRKSFYLSISLLDYFYWVGGTALGGFLGDFIPFDTTGLDFALTALFVVLFLEQWKKRENRPAGAIGICATVLCLLVFGADNLVIPAMQPSSGFSQRLK